MNEQMHRIDKALHIQSVLAGWLQQQTA